MRGPLLARDATIHAEPDSAIAGASSPGQIAAREQLRRSTRITTESLGLAAGPRAGRTVRSLGFATSWRRR